MKASDGMTSPVVSDHPDARRRRTAPDEKLDDALEETLSASDAFVVPWAPRALVERRGLGPGK